MLHTKLLVDRSVSLVPDYTNCCTQQGDAGNTAGLGCIMHNIEKLAVVDISHARNLCGEARHGSKAASQRGAYAARLRRP